MASPLCQCVTIVGDPDTMHEIAGRQEEEQHNMCDSMKTKEIKESIQNRRTAGGMPTPGTMMTTACGTTTTAGTSYDTGDWPNDDQPGPYLSQAEQLALPPSAPAEYPALSASPHIGTVYGKSGDFVYDVRLEFECIAGADLYLRPHLHRQV